MTEPDETIPESEPQPEEAPTPPDALPDEEEEQIEEEDDQSQPTAEDDAEALGMSRKEYEKRLKQMKGRATTFRNAFSEIMGEVANAYPVCPMCADFLPGFLDLEGPSEEAIHAIRGALGMPDLSNYQQAKHARRCDDCAGLGVVLSGSLVNGNQAISCPACKGSGYIVQPALGEPFQPPSPSNGQQQGEPMVGVNPDDPAVAELRARGFTVFPPIQTPAGP